MKLKVIFIFFSLLFLFSACSTTGKTGSDEYDYLYQAENSKDKEAAIASYLAGAKAHPNDAHLVYNAAYALASEGRFDEAVGILNPAIEANLNSLALYTLLSYCYRSDYRYREYEMTMRHLINLDPGYLDARIALMQFYQRQGRKMEAKREALDVLARKSDSAEALAVLGETNPFFTTLAKAKTEEAKVAESTKKVPEKTNFYLKATIKDWQNQFAKILPSLLLKSQERKAAKNTVTKDSEALPEDQTGQGDEEMRMPPESVKAGEEPIRLE